jgi:hypothetical protein
LSVMCMYRSLGVIVLPNIIMSKPLPESISNVTVSLGVTMHVSILPKMM